MANERLHSRWRLVLGRFAEESLPDAFPAGALYARMEETLDFLYGREYQGRGVRGEPSMGERQGGRERSVFSVPGWLREVRDLFPKETVEILERHALDRYGMTELVTDPEVLKKLEPSYDLLKTLLTFKGTMKGPVLEAARALIRQIVEELKRKLAQEVRPVLWGRLDRQRRSPLKVARNLDVKRTIRENLKTWDPERKRLLPARLSFFARVDRHLPWYVIMLVDCSGSMMDSIIHSAVMAGIFAGLPGLSVRLLAFDTAIADLSDHADDPAQVLMSVHLGGGTDIGGAMTYAEGLVAVPTRTLVVLVTDFCEGGPPQVLLASIKRLREAGVRVLGLLALDEKAEPVYDERMARRCVDMGAEVAALTPKRLAEWLSRAIS